MLALQLSVKIPHSTEEGVGSLEMSGNINPATHHTKPESSTVPL